MSTAKQKHPILRRHSQRQHLPRLTPSREPNGVQGRHQDSLQNSDIDAIANGLPEGCGAECLSSLLKLVLESHQCQQFIHICHSVLTCQPKTSLRASRRSDARTDPLHCILTRRAGPTVNEPRFFEWIAARTHDLFETTKEISDTNPVRRQRITKVVHVNEMCKFLHGNVPRSLEFSSRQHANSLDANNVVTVS